MPKLHPSLAPAIRALSEKEKEKLLLRFARAHQEMHDKLAFELLEEVTIESLEEEAKEVITDTMYNLTGRSLFKGLSRAITKALKEIARIKKITKEPKLEADLLRHLLHILFDNYGGQFDSPNRSYATKTARITLRLYTLIVKSLHPDFRIEYKPEVDNWLQTLHARASRYPAVNELPAELPE